RKAKPIAQCLRDFHWLNRRADERLRHAAARQQLFTHAAQYGARDHDRTPARQCRRANSKHSTPRVDDRASGEPRPQPAIELDAAIDVPTAPGTPLAAGTRNHAGTCRERTIRATRNRDDEMPGPDRPSITECERLAGTGFES